MTNQLYYAEYEYRDNHDKDLDPIWAPNIKEAVWIATMEKDYQDRPVVLKEVWKCGDKLRN